MITVTVLSGPDQSNYKMLVNLHEGIMIILKILDVSEAK